MSSKIPDNFNGIQPVTECRALLLFGNMEVLPIGVS